MKTRYEVREVGRSECERFVIGIHYAKRWPSISFSYGLFEGDDLVGVVTYGTPPSAPLRSGLAGAENASRVIELNRLCLLNNKPNEASFLVSRSLKMLPCGLIVISFADQEQNHKGFVYQACNFSYHGLSAKRTDWKVKGMEHLHGQTIADEFRGSKCRVDEMRKKYGEDFYLSPRSRKHRYIYVTGGKRFSKLRDSIKYKTQEYPK